MRELVAGLNSTVFPTISLIYQAWLPDGLCVRDLLPEGLEWGGGGTRADERGRREWSLGWPHIITQVIHTRHHAWKKVLPYPERSL
jgi:hypothetical protein